jgi:amino acid transporter
LTYLSTSNGSSLAFQWFQNLTTIAQLFTWCCVCIAYIRFHAALQAQGIPRDSLIFRSKFQPYTAWCALVFFTIIIIFNGFAVFINGNWSTSNFLTAYINIPLFFGLFAIWKIFKKTKLVSAADADLHTGKAAMDAEEWIDQKPRNILEKVRLLDCPLVFQNTDRVSRFGFGLLSFQALFVLGCMVCLV